MCGIFGFMLSKPQKIGLALEVLKILETHQYSGEKHPVGGHGAGIYFLDVNQREVLAKVGKTNESPVEALSKQFSRQSQTRLLMGHVRRASPDFLNTISFSECTQPYIAACNRRLKIVSVHNGFVENYKELHKKLRLKHLFESEKKKELIDSEVLSHFLEELLLNKVDIAEALSMLSVQLENQKGNTASMLLLGGERMGNFLVFVHCGRTRGLIIWNNPEGEVVFSSRKEPVKQVLGGFLREHAFEEKLSIAWNEPKHVKPVIFTLPKDVIG
jgi:glucosamine 6-phosphate synthetase-like amidotransferase/phosphosugar isomerase protein